MIQPVTEHDFVSAFLDWNTYKDCFSYEGLKSLFEHFEDVIEDTGEQIELDVVAMCGEYEEFENLDGFHARYGKTFFSRNDDNVLQPLDITHIRTIDDLREITTVIPVRNTDRIIVWCI